MSFKTSHRRLLNCFFISTIITIGGSLHAQPAENRTDAKGRKQGSWVKYYDNDSLQYEGYFVDDKPQGTFKRYYPDGGIQALLHYNSSVQTPAKVFYPDHGGLMAEGNYKNQNRDSIWLFYDENKTLTSSESFQDGKRNGWSIIYYSDGSVSEKAMYKDDEKQGSWNQYFQNGNPKLKATVKDGVKFIGEYETYYPDGQTLLKGKYVDGRKESSWYHYNEDGSIEVIYVYRYGKVIETYPKNGNFDEYYPNDIKKADYAYKKGVKSGPFKEYYPKGEWVTETGVDDFGNAQLVQKLKGIQLKREGKYKDGVLHGEVITYAEDGTIQQRERYNMGTLEL